MTVNFKLTVAEKPLRALNLRGLTLRIFVDMMYDPRLQIYCNSPFRLLSQALASHGGRTRNTRYSVVRRGKHKM